MRMGTFEEEMSPEEWVEWKKKRVKIPKRKMPKKGSLITVIHGKKDDLTRIKEIIERYGLNAKFKEIEK